MSSISSPSSVALETAPRRGGRALRDEAAQRPPEPPPSDGASADQFETDPRARPARDERSPTGSNPSTPQTMRWLPRGTPRGHRTPPSARRVPRRSAKPSSKLTTWCQLSWRYPCRRAHRCNRDTSDRAATDTMAAFTLSSTQFQLAAGSKLAVRARPPCAPPRVARCGRRRPQARDDRRRPRLR